MKNSDLTSSKSASSAEKIQTRKVGVAGNFMNQMMGNNKSLPEVGQWATILHYSDRTISKVLEVSKDGKEAKIQHFEIVANADASKIGHGHQCWNLEPTDGTSKLVWKYNRWNFEVNNIYFTKALIDEAEINGYFSASKYLKENRPELFEEVYPGNSTYPQKVIAGITKPHKSYNRVSILFGVCDPYYDWSF